MPTSKHQRNLAVLRHRYREAHETAAKYSIAFIRSRTEDRGALLDAVAAVAELDAIAQDLALVEAEMPGKLRAEKGEGKGERG